MHLTRMKRYSVIPFLPFPSNVPLNKVNIRNQRIPCQARKQRDTTSRQITERQLDGHTARKIMKKLHYGKFKLHYRKIKFISFTVQFSRKLFI